MIKLQPQQLDGIKSGIRFALAGLLGLIFYLSFDMLFGYWTVVTIAAVMQPSIDTTTKKCILRLLGTIFGVMFSYISIILLRAIPSSLIIIFFVNMFLAGLLIFADKKNSYFGVIFGATYIIVITTYDATPAVLYNVAIDRTVDVSVGILIGWACTKWLLPTHYRDIEQKSNLKFNLQMPPLKYALTIAVATTVSLVPWFIFHYPGGYWAAFACLMVIEESLDQTQKKAFERLIAHIIVLVITAVLSVMLDNVYGLAVALMLGLFIFGYVMENTFFNFSSNIATTMAIAFCVVLLAAPGELNTLNTVFIRFINTLLGITVGIGITTLVNTKYNLRDTTTNKL